MTKQRLRVVVTGKSILADRVMGFELKSPDNKSLPPFTAGAHIDIELPGGIVRQYSLCNDPTEHDRYELGILLEPEGRGGSRSAHMHLSVGDHVWISEPRNHFPLEDERGDILLIAGGIGITPLLSMAAVLHRAGKHFTLHYCARSRQSSAFLDRLAQSPFSKNVVTHFNEEDPAQRFDAEHILQSASPTSHLYTCGPTGFMDHVLDTARSLGWSDQRLHLERFAAPTPDSDDTTDFVVEIASTGQEITVGSDQSVAEALLEAGVEVSLSCEQGICGECAMKVSSGEPDHRDMFFSEDEHVEGRYFTPCCSRSHSQRLVLEA